MKDLVAGGVYRAYNLYRFLRSLDHATGKTFRNYFECLLSIEYLVLYFWLFVSDRRMRQGNRGTVCERSRDKKNGLSVFFIYISALPSSMFSLLFSLHSRFSGLRATTCWLLAASMSRPGAAAQDGALFDKSRPFSSLGLDTRLFKAAARLKFVYPTVVQAHCIPLALQGHDLLVRARTGSGKTLAYILPILQRLLASDDAPDTAGTQALVLVPTRELCDQVEAQFRSMMHYCDDLLSILALSARLPVPAQVARLKERPSILVATPTGLIEYLQNGLIALKRSLKFLVVDEADLVLSYGYEDDVKTLIDYLPKLHQSMLMSATLTPEVQSLQGLMLNKPKIFKDKQETSSGQQGSLTEQYVRCPQDDKLLLTYVFLMLGLIKPKTLFFVNSIERAFRLKLFLEQFSIASAVLNAELPYNSRHSMLTQFNRGVFDVLIATDACLEKDELDHSAASAEAAESSEDEAQLQEAADEPEQQQQQEQEQEEEKEEEQQDQEEGEQEEDGGQAVRGKVAARPAEQGEEEEDDEEEEDGEDGRAADEAGSSSGQAGQEEEEDEDEDEDEEGTVGKAEEAGKMPGNAFLTAEPDQNVGQGKQRGKRRQQQQQQQQQGRQITKKALTSGVSRGVDFRDVRTVVNFDLPTSVKAYVHRIGRTARGGKAGVALSLVSLQELPQLDAVLQAQQKRAAARGLANPHTLQEVQHDKAAVEKFRYRCSDAARRITPALVREARLAEVKQEILNSKKLRDFFSENPRELRLLRHDRVLKPAVVSKQLAVVPDYLLPERPADATSLKNMRQVKNRKKNLLRNARLPKKLREKNKRRQDPLQSYAAGNSAGAVVGASALAAWVAGDTSAAIQSSSGTHKKTNKRAARHAGGPAGAHKKRKIKQEAKKQARAARKHNDIVLKLGLFAFLALVKVRDCEMVKVDGTCQARDLASALPEHDNFFFAAYRLLVKKVAILSGIFEFRVNIWPI
eukprot:g45799.t1